MKKMAELKPGVKVLLGDQDLLHSPKNSQQKGTLILLCKLNNSHIFRSTGVRRKGVLGRFPHVESDSFLQVFSTTVRYEQYWLRVDYKFNFFSAPHTTREKDGNSGAAKLQNSTQASWNRKCCWQSDCDIESRARDPDPQAPKADPQAPNAPVAGHAPPIAADNAAAALYDYRKCLVDKREALKNPGILQGTLQEQLAAARAHFHSSTIANDPHISIIVQSLNDHIWDPSSDTHQPFPHHKNIAAPCTKKMYAEWNLAVNGVLKRFSNDAFMTWKHNKAQEFFQWEDLKSIVDMFMLKQIQMGIITGDLEKKSRNNRQAENGADLGPAKKRARNYAED
ncbi:hypothetical protein CAEBREN_10490 [Caenorhabditis brenneri]|uniref:Uncharacterized protein n=1 Tax=Caenorhabditis brenneri TaxID=135651 RepID=G0P4Z7_CAEBE|nr:hypothetical protein CAEBREN_10490 [Caenorhabditis brenneri]